MLIPTDETLHNPSNSSVRTFLGSSDADTSGGGVPAGETLWFSGLPGHSKPYIPKLYMNPHQSCRYGSVSTIFYDADHVDMIEGAWALVTFAAEETII